jgi:hypothetical protein
VSDQGFSHEEILGGGLSRIRRARAIVFLLESEARRIGDRNSALASASPEAGGLFAAILDGDPELMRRSLPGEADSAFIESFRNARRRSKPAASRLLENTVDSWKVPLPDEIPLRAEVLHPLSLRHGLPRNRSRRSAAEFGVGQQAFDDAYLRVVGDPSSTAFGPDLGWFASLRKSSATL